MPKIDLSWCKPGIEFLLTWYERLRIRGLTKYSGIVVLSGIGVITISFNDVLFNLFLKPAGFSQQDPWGPVTGLTLVVLGLAGLIVDRAVPARAYKPSEHDQALFAKYHSVIDWNTTDALLDNLHNEYIWKEEIDRSEAFNCLFRDVSNHFNDGDLQGSLSELHAEVLRLLRIIAYNFFSDDASYDSEPKRYNRSLFLPSISVERTGQSHPKYFEAKRELDTAIASFEASLKKFLTVARRKAVIDVNR